MLIYTDHKNLIFFIITKQFNRRQIRWFEELFKYDFKIIYRKKSENKRVNTLNHKPNYF